MRLIVIIATAGRKGILSQTLRHLERQSRLPERVIVSAPDESHVEGYRSGSFEITYLFGRRGLTAQRNHALDAALPHCDAVSFFDDDFLPADTYIEKVVEAFTQHDTWVAITGRVIKDGITGAGLTFAEGDAALDAAAKLPFAGQPFTEIASAYGCNMSFRTCHIGNIRFDERLVLYGWQEDVDFSSQFARFGSIVRLNTLVGVHLGAKSGRISGVRFGYSQIANPVYLIRKGTVPVRTAATLMLRNVAANAFKSAFPEPWIDRRGRLWGNVLAGLHVARRRIEPEYILKL